MKKQTTPSIPRLLWGALLFSIGVYFLHKSGSDVLLGVIYFSWGRTELAAYREGKKL